MLRGTTMHTMAAVLGVFVNILLVVAILSIIVGLVWTIFPLKDRIYLTANIYRDYTPLGGRGTGLVILGCGFAGLILGFALDEAHIKLTRKFGARI